MNHILALAKAESVAHAQKRVTPRSPPPDQPPESDDHASPPPPPSKSAKRPVNINECFIMIGAITYLDKDEIFVDAGEFKLGAFSVHEYNAKAIIRLDYTASKAKVNYEHFSSIAMLSTPRNASVRKTIEDPANFKSLEDIAKRWFLDGTKTCRVDYKVSYIRKRIQFGSATPMHSGAPLIVNGGDEDDGESQTGMKRRKVHTFLECDC